MSPKFDLFMKLSDGQPIWIKAVEGLEEAKGELRQMAVAALLGPSRRPRLLPGRRAATTPPRGRA